jgi:hypothetical protein
MHHLFATNAGIMPKELSGRMQWTPFTDKKWVLDCYGGWKTFCEFRDWYWNIKGKS